jgi:hypothetical protein
MYGNAGHDVLIDLTCLDEARMSGGPGEDRFESYFDNLQGVDCSERWLRRARPSHRRSRA